MSSTARAARAPQARHRRRARRCPFPAEGQNGPAGLAWVVLLVLIPFDGPVLVDYHEGSGLDGRNFSVAMA